MAFKHKKISITNIISPLKTSQRNIKSTKKTKNRKSANIETRMMKKEDKKDYIEMLHTTTETVKKRISSTTLTFKPWKRKLDCYKKRKKTDLL